MTLRDFEISSQKSLPFDGKYLQPAALITNPSPSMPLIDAIGTRRTSRRYAEEMVPRQTFDWLVRHAMHAPSACNEQQWKIVLIDDPEIIKDLYERGSASFLAGVKQCFVVCYNRRSDNIEWLDHVQSGAAFIALFQLLAHTIGIGSCWVGHLPNKSEVARLLHVHKYYEPVALVSFGYYRQKLRVMPRKRDASEVVMENHFVSRGLVFPDPRRTLFRTVIRYFYYKVPPFIRRKLKARVHRFEKKFYYEIFD